jgi:hypothetical protein
VVVPRSLLISPKAFTISSDGTDVRRVTTSSKQMHLPKRAVYSSSGTEFVDEPVTRTLPVSTLTDHTAKTQFTDWEGTFKDFFDTYSRWRGRPITVQDWRELVLRFAGFMADHAADQLLLFELFVNWKAMIVEQALGAQALAGLSEDEMLEQMAQHVLSREEDSKLWCEMTSEEQDEFKAKAWVELCASAGKESFEQLTTDEKRRFTLMIRGGCYYHKSINAFKEGAAGVSAFWSERGLPGPVRLVSKVTASHIKGLSTEQAEKILNSSRAGGIALTNNAGMIRSIRSSKVC